MTVAVPTRPPFVEPTRGITPRALYLIRYVGGIALLVIAVWLLLGVYVIAAARLGMPTGTALTARAVVGYLLFAAAWFVLPGRIARAALAALIATVSLWVFVNTIPFAEPGLVGGFLPPGLFLAWVFKPIAVTGFVAAWFVVRRRPPLVYPLLLVPFLAYAILSAITGRGLGAFADVFAVIARSRDFAPIWQPLNALDHGWDLTAGLLVGLLLVTVGTAWLGRVLAPLMRRTDPAERAARLAAQQAAWQAHAYAQAQAHAQADAAWRVAEITRWEDAYAAAHNGERPPPGWSPPPSPR